MQCTQMYIEVRLIVRGRLGQDMMLEVLIQVRDNIIYLLISKSKRLTKLTSTKML
jgi:hypothetical protein